MPSGWSPGACTCAALDVAMILSSLEIERVVRNESHFDVELDDEVVFRVRNVRELASAILEDLESDDSKPLSAAGAGT